MLSILSDFISQIPEIQIDGIYGSATRNAVLAAQRYFGLPQTGSVDEATWEEIYDQFSGIENTVLRSGETFPQVSGSTAPRNRYSRTSTFTQFPGSDLRPGQSDPRSQEVVR